MLGQKASVGHKVQAFRALRHSNFRWFWVSTTAQAAARSMQFLILGWLVLVITDSASQLGLVFFLYGIPNLTFVLFGGIFADRIDRRKLLISSQALVTLIILGLATLTMTNLVAMWHLYAVTFLLGTLQALNMPSRMAIVADLVDREDIMNAVSLNSAVMNSGRIFGPAVAGGLIELTDISAALYLNGGCYLVGTACLLLVRSGLQQQVARDTTILRDLREGLDYFFKTPVTLMIIGLGFAFGFFGMPYLRVMPAFAKETLDVGAGGAGVLIAAAGVGSLLGNVVLASLGDFRHKNWLLIGSAFTFGLSLLLFAWSPWFWLSWMILLVVGMGSSVYISVGTTVLQLHVPPELLGRVLSLWYVTAGLMFIGALPVAAAADALGWPIAFTGGATLFLVAASWLGLWRPTLRKLRL